MCKELIHQQKSDTETDTYAGNGSIDRAQWTSVKDQFTFPEGPANGYNDKMWIRDSHSSMDICQGVRAGMRFKVSSISR